MADDRKATLLKTVTGLAKTPEEVTEESAKATLSFALDKVVDDVCAYTHIAWDELPVALNTTIAALTLNAINELGLLSAVSDDSGTETSLSEGDVSISFMSPLDALNALAGANTITTNYRATLNTFRKVAR